MKVEHLSSLFEKKFKTWSFSQKKNIFETYLKKQFLQKYMLDFREMRSQIKGHGALYLFKQKTSENMKQKLKIHEIEKKIPDFYTSFKLLIFYCYKTAGQFFYVIVGTLIFLAYVLLRII